MWSKVDQFVKKHHMLDEAGCVLIGLSGGADSVCLARYFLDLRKKGGPEISAVHVNHMLRDSEAERDEEFVRDFCRKTGLPLTLYREDVRRISVRDKLSLEEAGRKVRYACFRETASKLADRGKVRIALGHHADDLAETMVFRMIRGTGPRGLTGIPPVRGDIIRPFLGIRKEEIRAILQELGQDFVEDSSNQDPAYSRNLIRHQILDVMNRMNPKTVDHMCRLARREADLLACVEPRIESAMSLVRRDGPDRWSVEAEDLLALPDYVRDEVAGRMLHAAAGRKKDIESVHIDQMTDLLYKKAGKRINLPWGLAARRTDSRIIVSRNEGVPEGDREEKYDREGLCIKVCLPDYAEGLQWTVPLDTETGLVMQYRSYHGQQIIKSDCEKYFDYDRISKELSIRTRRPGDYFVFNDQGEHKKLSRFFIDEKIPADERESRMLLADGSHILWIIGRRISEACKVTSGTKQMLAVSLTKYKR